MATTVTRIGNLRGNTLVEGITPVSGGYDKYDLLLYTTDAIDPGALAADSAATSDASNVVADATGVTIGDAVLSVASKGAAADPINQAGVQVTARATDADELTIDFHAIGAASNPGTQVFEILVLKLT